MNFKNLSVTLLSIILLIGLNETALFAKENSKISKKCCNKEKPARQLTVLLINDDGFTTSNILAMQAALLDKGYNVYTFLPGFNASGLGGGFICGRYILDEIDTNFFLLSPNPADIPADAVEFLPPTTDEVQFFAKKYMYERLGIRQLDLVVSGINVGINTSSAGPLASGTVTGALGATTELVPYFKNTPAIAASLTDIRDAARRDLAAQFVADLAEYLDKHRDCNDRLLPKDTALSVNIPAVNWPVYIASNTQTIEMITIKGVTLNRAGKFYSNVKGSSTETFGAEKLLFATNIEGQAPIAAVPGALSLGNFLSVPTTELVMADPFLANDPLKNAAAVKGKIALVSRGGGLFQNKLANVQAAGAVGMIIVDNTDEAPFSVGTASATDNVIPSAMISLADGTALINALQTQTVTITTSPLLTQDGHIQYDLLTGYYGKVGNDVPASDNSAVADGYIAITPLTLAQPESSKKIESLCCLLKPVLTEGPNLCKEFGFCGNKQSILLPPTSAEQKHFDKVPCEKLEENSGQVAVFGKKYWVK